MKLFVVATLFLASACSAHYGAVSSQYHTQDSLGQYSYGYADPNSQKHESRSADGTTHGAYSYVDGHGVVQSVKYTADPHHGFQAVGTNLPKGPEVHAIAPLAYAHAPVVAYHASPVYASPWAHHASPVVIGHDGRPIDTPEVQHARAEHLAAVAIAKGAHSYAPIAHAAPWGYSAHANGAPHDTPEVAHAKAEHFAAHAAARSGHHAYAPAAHYQHGPVIHNGVPVETPEVQHAKAAHFQAHAEAAHAAHHLYKRSLWGNHAYAAYAAAPVIQNGVPVETPEVQHAKAAHFAAHAAAKGAHSYAPVAHAAPWGYAQAHGNGAPHDTPEVAHAKAEHFAAHAAARSGVQAYAPAAHYQHVPVIHNGVPVDTPEVQHAKAAHLAAHAKVASQSYSHGNQWDNQYDDGHYATAHYAPAHYAEAHYEHVPVIHNGVPVDTPEVQHAKAAHLAAHAKVASQSYSHGNQWDNGHHDDGHYNGHYEQQW